MRQSMIMTRGDFYRIVERPIVASFLILALFAMTAPILLKRMRLRGKPVQIEQEAS